MANSRTKNSVLNMATSVAIRVSTLILSFVSRTVFIYILGAEYLGLNGLFSNILSFLALSELGLGSAIAFLLYKPIAENDVERMKTVMHFYKRCYVVVGAAILFLGCCLMPFLNSMVTLDKPIPENLYLVFFLFVLQSAVSYFFAAYKQTFVNANQKAYLLGKIEISFTIINCAVDIVVLLLLRDFLAYLTFKIVVVIIKNLVLSRKVDKLYPFLTEKVNTFLTKEEIRSVFKDIYSVTVFRLGSVLFNSVSNIVTSAIIGTIVVGYYSNYTMIVSQVEVLIMLAFNAVAAGIGNVVATETKEKQFAIYKKIDFITSAIYILSTVCLVQLLNSFIKLWLGHMAEDYVMSQFVVILIAASMYQNCSCQVLERFRTANGLFKIGRDMQVIGGVVNIILSVVMAKLWGFEGVLIAPFLSKMFITVTPYVARVGNKSFGKSFGYMIKEYFAKALLVCAMCTTVWFLCINIHCTSILNFIFEIIITIVVSLLMLSAFYYRTEEFKCVINIARTKLSQRHHK